jgi:predicted neutral ceramidase superfamily lipid hydrolase
MNFRAIYESAKNEREHNLREDNASYELVDPVAGLQPTKKVVVMDPSDDRTQYIWADGTNVTEWLDL